MSKNIFFRKSESEKVSSLLKKVKINFVKIFNFYTGDFIKTIFDENPRILIENAGTSDANGYYDKVIDDSEEGGYYWAKNNGDAYYKVIRKVFGVWKIQSFGVFGAYFYSWSKDNLLDNTGEWTESVGELPLPTADLIYNNTLLEGSPDLIIKNNLFEINQSVANFDKETEIELNQYFNYFNIDIVDELSVTNEEDYLIQVNFNGKIIDTESKTEVNSFKMLEV